MSLKNELREAADKVEQAEGFFERNIRWFRWLGYAFGAGVLLGLLLILVF